MGKAAVIVRIYAIGNSGIGMAVSLRFVASSLSEADVTVIVTFLGE